MKKERYSRERIEGILRRVTSVVRPCVSRFAWVGSYRRLEPLCGDADILVTPQSKNLLRVVRYLGDDFYGALDFMFIRLDGVPVNVFACEPHHWGSSLQYTTGSMEHNIALRSYAKRHDLTANQYGVFEKRKMSFSAKAQRVNGKTHVGKTHVDLFGTTAIRKLQGSSETETGFYISLGLRWPRPEVRVSRTLVQGLASYDLAKVRGKQSPGLFPLTRRT